MKETNENFDINNMQWIGLKTFVDQINVAFGYEGRFIIMKALSESPKTFEELETAMKARKVEQGIVVHLEALSKSALIYTNKENKYAFTIMGEVIFNYFSDFLKEAQKLQLELSKEE